MKYIISILIFVIVLLLAACENSNSPSKNTSEAKISKEVYLKKGQQIAAATFATLSKNLQKAMQEGGISNAIKYCNLAAIPLVDSLSQVHQAEIRRTSLKVRNPKDSPTPQELKQLEIYQNQVNTNEDLKPVIKEIDANTIAFYAPIHIMPLCEKCHGKVGDTLMEKDNKLIKRLYPNDKAVGYATNDWRGIWSISFKK